MLYMHLILHTISPGTLHFGFSVGIERIFSIMEAKAKVVGSVYNIVELKVHYF